MNRLNNIVNVNVPIVTSNIVNTIETPVIEFIDI